MRLLSLIALTVLGAAFAYGGEFTAGKTLTGGMTPKTGSNQTMPLIIGTKGCEYICEARYNPETKRSEIRLQSKECSGSFSKTTGWVFDKHMDIGLNGRHVKSGTNVTVYDFSGQEIQ